MALRPPVRSGTMEESSSKARMLPKVLHLIDSGGVYGAENVVLNLAREMVLNGEFAPIVGCIVNSEGQQVDLLDSAERLGIDAIRVVINNKLLPWHLLSIFTLVLEAT